MNLGDPGSEWAREVPDNMTVLAWPAPKGEGLAIWVIRGSMFFDDSGTTVVGLSEDEDAPILEAWNCLRQEYWTRQRESDDDDVPDGLYLFCTVDWWNESIPGVKDHGWPSKREMLLPVEDVTEEWPGPLARRVGCSLEEAAANILSHHPNAQSLRFSAPGKEDVWA